MSPQPKTPDSIHQIIAPFRHLLQPSRRNKFRTLPRGQHIIGIEQRSISFRNAEVHLLVGIERPAEAIGSHVRGRIGAVEHGARTAVGLAFAVLSPIPCYADASVVTTFLPAGQEATCGVCMG